MPEHDAAAHRHRDLRASLAARATFDESAGANWSFDSARYPRAQVVQFVPPAPPVAHAPMPAHAGLARRASAGVEQTAEVRVSEQSEEGVAAGLLGSEWGAMLLGTIAFLAGLAALLFAIFAVRYAAALAFGAIRVGGGALAKMADPAPPAAE
jgi:hypothetical protein